MEEKKASQRPEEANDISAQSSAGAARYEEILMREAYEHIAKMEYEAAVNVFTDILRRSAAALDIKQKSVIYSELGTLFFWLGDYNAAEKYCEDAVAMTGTNDHAYAILGKIAVARFQFPKARGYFSKISADNPARYLGLSLISLRLRDTSGAETFLRDAARLLPPSDVEFLVYRAYLMLLKGDAVNAVSEARGIQPKCKRDPFLSLIIAEIFMTAGNYGEASAAAKATMEHCPNNDLAAAVLAHGAYAEEDFTSADKYARLAIENNPFNAYAKTVLMKLAVRSGNYSLAENIGTQILNDCPEYSLGHANLGDVYFIQGRYDMARLEYEQTLQLMTADTKGARLRQARVQFIKGQYQAAIDILKNIVETYHTYYDDAICDLALCYDKIGDEEKKQNVIEKMRMRRDFYHRTEKLLQSFAQK